MATSSAPRSGRLRLVVIQALVFSLFATLLARLYYLQVVDGEEYHAQAASQSVREIVVQPQRGLIVDDQGRPLVANRMSWVVSLDRNVLAKMSERQQDVLLDRVAGVVTVPARTIQRKLVTCGDPGGVAGSCWNGSPYQPVPIAFDVPQRVALRILEQPEDYPAVVAEQQSVRAYPRPFGVNLAHVLGYLSPITEREYDRAQENDDTSLNGASSVGRAGVEKEYDRWLRGMPGYESVAVDSMGRVLGDGGDEVAGQPGDTLVTSIDAQVQAVVERAARADDRHRAGDPRHGDRPQLRRRLGCRDRDGGRHRPDRRDGQPADVRPRGLGRRHHRRSSSPGSTPRRPVRRCSAGPPRASSRPARRGSRS